MTERQRRILELAAAWALPLAVWLLATGWLGFDLGKYSDDWAVSLRVPETDAYRWPLSPFIRWDYFWRPLHLLAVYGLATVFWHHDWVNHLISALCHLGVGLLIYRLLRSVNITAVAARLSISVFLAIPLSIEAVLWPAALGSVVGAAWLLLMALLCVRWVRAASAAPRIATLKWFATLAFMGFCTACWHEQPAAGVLALPLCFFAAGGTSRDMFRRGAVATIAAGSGVLVYVLLFIATVPPGRRGGANTLTGLSALSDRLSRLGQMSWELSLGGRAWDTTLDAIQIGWAHANHAAGFWLAAALISLAAGLFFSRSLRPGAITINPPVRSRRGWIALFGAAVAIMTLVPIALVIWQPMHPRYLYATGMGAVIVLAACIDPIFAARPARIPVIRALAAATLIAFSLALALACLGWQVQFRDRWIADEAQAAQLKRLLPDPLRDALFVPVELADSPSPALRRRNPGIAGALAQPWSCWAYIQRAYRRSDLSATHLRPGQKPPVVADDAGVRYPRGISNVYGRTSPGDTSAAWARVVPFAVDQDGVVRLLSREEAQRRLGGAPASDE